MNKFSIILPVKNGINYIESCVSSILSQNYTSFNLIILDNKSTDGTSEFIQSLTDTRVIYINADTDLSMPKNWERALGLSLNEYITFIGHDDLLHSNYLQEMNSLISSQPEASLYQLHFNYIDAQSNLVRKCQPMPSKITVDDFLKFQFLRTMDSMGTGYMFRAKDFKQLGGWPVHYPNLIFGDYQLFVELCGLRYLAVSPQVGFSYRLHVSLSILTHIDQYRLGFKLYLQFLNAYQKGRDNVQRVISEYGKIFLLYHCQSLSHRLLKADENVNRMRVEQFIKECEADARQLGILDFKPNSKFKIWIAAFLDKTALRRKLFRALRRKLK